MSRVSPKRKGPSRGREALPAAVVGLTVSGLLAALLAIKTPEVAVLGVAVALLGSLVGLTYDLIRRVDERSDAEDHRSALLAAAENRGWLLDGLRETATFAKNAMDDDRNAELFENLILDKIEETRLFMQDLERGRVRVPAGDLTQMASQMANQIDSVEDKVRATTIPKIDNEWWLSKAGGDYLDRNRHAIEEKSVEIERIVLWDEDDNFKTLADVIKQQQAAGVKVLFAQRSEIGKKPGLKTNVALYKTNIAIYDESSYNEVVFNFEGEEIYIEYYLEPSDAKKAIARFEQLHGLATATVPPALEPFMKD